MAKEPAKTRKGIFSYILLTVFLCVLALRATNAESINISMLSSWANLGGDLESLIFTSILLGCVLLWLVRITFQKTFTYSFTALELPVLLFLIAGLLGIAIASNKRAAVNDFVTMTVPILAAIMLVQILDSDSRIRLVLAAIIALACASAYRCAGQFFTETQMMINQYESDPQSMLAPLGLTAGSFEAWLFEHRLYTKGVSGFLTTGNSVASFSILAVFAAIALFLEQIKSFIKTKSARTSVVMTAAALIVVLFNFIFVRSKGGSAAFALALLLFIVLLCFGPFIKRHRKKIFILFLLILIFSAAVVINYGRSHGRLPGGNSMLVRWQYWTGAAQMYADHPVTGVGPGNFDSYYSHYKAPPALETVKDPHNFALSILAQYGPLGLAAFLALLFVPLWRTLNPSVPPNPDIGRPLQLKLRTLLFPVILIAAALLIVRPILNPVHTEGEPFVAIAVAAFTLYIGPVVVFFLGFALAWSFSHRHSRPLTDITTKALFCACIGICIHNLIDFAVFEPGVYTTLWAILACLIATSRLSRNRQASVYTISLPLRIVLSLSLAVSAWAFCRYAVLPVGQSVSLLHQARNDYEAGLLDHTQVLLKAAAQKDTLNPQPSISSATLYLQYLDYYGPKQKDILALAEKSLHTAAERDPAYFLPYEKLTAVYKLLADKSSGDSKTEYLRKSFDAASKAVELYPGLGRLRIALAEAAEHTGKFDTALENYKKAVQIEDAYRAQFKMMYPDRELFSRLGRKKYDYAKQRIEELKN